MAHVARENSTSQAPAPTSIWRVRNFLVLFVTGLLVAFGSRVYELALPLLLYESTRSSVVMGTMRAVEFLPNLLLAMFIGVLVDRWRKKPVLLASLAIQALLLFVLYGVNRTGPASVYVFYLTGFVLMTFSYTHGNVRTVITRHSLPRELLLPANANFTMIGNFTNVMGPAITGLILMLSDIRDGLLITGTMLSAALLINLFIKLDEERKPRSQTTIMQDLKEGWRILYRNRPLWLITLVVVITNASEGMVNAMIVFYAKDTLQLNNSVLGLVLSAGGVGALLSSFVIGRLRRRIPIGRLIGFMFVLVGASYVLLGFATNACVMALSQFFNALFGMIYSISVWTYRQEVTPPEVIGRITGITGSLFKLGVPFTIFMAGWLANLASATYVFFGAAVINFILFAVYLRLPNWKTT